MANLVHHNRRAPRRLLARYFEGERDFIVQHPVSRAWFERHPRVEREKWLDDGIEEPEVENVLSTHFWHDGAWELTPPARGEA